MKLARFRVGQEARLGAVVHEQVVDLRAALAAALAGAGASAETARAEARERVPASMREFLAGGDAPRHVAHEAVAFHTSAPGHQHDGRPIAYPLASTPLLAPIADPQKIICVGQNYRDHCEEQNQPLPERAIIFAKFATAINDPGAPILLPRVSQQVDYEAELAFVIGRRAKHVAEADAREYIAGYTCLNDVSARDIQLHPAEKQWIKGKTPDTFCPLGPWIVTPDEIPDPQHLDIRLVLNGQVMQSSNTCNLIFGIGYLLSHLSQSITLEPGDIISTGTPGGVGMYRKPQVFLKPGDEVSVTIEHLGTLTNPVASEE